MRENRIKALVLAAGRGVRLQSEASDLPKVLRTAAGRPLLSHVLDALSFLPPEDVILVVGYRREAVTDAYPAYPAAVQEEQLGTGHAALSAEPLLQAYTGALLVCCGDMPLMRRETYLALIDAHFRGKNACTLLSGRSEEPLSYGRVIRDADGAFLRVAEERDCAPEELEIRELNAGVYVFDAPALFGALHRLRPDNAQGEYYLTDVPALLARAGARVCVRCACTPEEMLGVNTPAQLEAAERALLARRPAEAAGHTKERII